MKNRERERERGDIKVFVWWSIIVITIIIINIVDVVDDVVILFLYCC